MRWFYSCRSLRFFSYASTAMFAKKECGHFLNRHFKKFGKRLIFGWLQPVGFPVDASFRLHHVKSVGMPGHARCVLGTSMHHLKHGRETKFKKITFTLELSYDRVFQ